MVTLFKPHYFFLLLSLILLQSCQHHEENSRDVPIRTHKLADAAIYNMQLGLAYLKQGDRPRAKRKLLVALEQAPESADVNSAMAFYLEKTGSITEAKTYYNKALALATSKGAQLNNYGAFLCRQGQYQQAENYLLQAATDVSYVNSAGAYENAGLCAMAIPNYNKAVEYFARALEQDPTRRQSLYELVNIEIKRAQAAKALSYLKDYQQLTLKDKTLLALAIDVAHQAEKTDLAAYYKKHLQQLTHFSDTGVNYEYHRNNG